MGAEDSCFFEGRVSAGLRTALLSLIEAMLAGVLVISDTYWYVPMKASTRYRDGCMALAAIEESS